MISEFTYNCQEYKSQIEIRNVLFFSFRICDDEIENKTNAVKSIAVAENKNKFECQSLWIGNEEEFA